MSLLDKIIHQLDEQYQNIPYHKNEFDDIKGLYDVVESNLNAGDLCFKMAREIHFIISKYEQRIRVLSIRYDNSLSPWQISFFLQCNFVEDAFREFNLEIAFKNDRHCEVK